MSGVLGWLAAAGIPVEHWERITPTTVPAVSVEEATGTQPVVAEPDLTPVMPSTDGRDHHVCCEHANAAERECSRLRAELMHAEGSLMQRPTWGVEA